MIVLIGLIETKTNNIFERRNLLNLSFKREEIIGALRSNWQSVEPYTAKLEAVFSSSDDLPQVIAALENAVLRTKNTGALRLLDLSPAPGAEGVLRLRFEQELSGNLGTFLDYLNAAEYLPYLIQFDSVNITSSESIDDKSAMRLNGWLYLK